MGSGHRMKSLAYQFFQGVHRAIRVASIDDFLGPNMAAIVSLQFTGAYRDPVAAGYPLGSGYRWYLPPLMRFNAPDALSPFDAGGVNPYAYCGDDPINRVDPSGHAWGLGWARRFDDDIVEPDPPKRVPVALRGSILKAQDAPLATVANRPFAGRAVRFARTARPADTATGQWKVPGEKSLNNPSSAASTMTAKNYLENAEGDISSVELALDILQRDVAAAANRFEGDQNSASNLKNWNSTVSRAKQGRDSAEGTLSVAKDFIDDLPPTDSRTRALWRQYRALDDRVSAASERLQGFGPIYEQPMFTLKLPVKQKRLLIGKKPPPL